MSWRWPQWLLFVLAVLVLVSYFGLISMGRVERELDRLAARSGGELVTEDTGRREALFIVFAFLLLTPVAVGVAAGIPMLASATAGALLHQPVPPPAGGGAPLLLHRLAL